MNQTTAIPTAKVTAGALAGAGSVLLVWALSMFGIDVPGEAASAITTILAFAVGYAVPDRAPVENA